LEKLNKRRAEKFGNESAAVCISCESEPIPSSLEKIILFPRYYYSCWNRAHRV